MARTQAQAEQDFHTLVAMMSSRMAEAFTKSIGLLAASVDYLQLVEAIESRDFSRVESFFNNAGASFGTMDDLIDETFRTSARQIFDNLPPIRDPYSGSKLVITFNARQDRAERIIRERSSQLIQGISAQENLLPTVRSAIENGVAQGQGSRKIATSIVGTLDRSTGQRTGGVLGLTTQQLEAVQAAETILRGGDPAEIRKLLRSRSSSGVWPHRYTKKLQRLIEAGKKPTKDDVDKIIREYNSKSLAYRGKAIASTEAHASAAAGQFESFQQLIDSGMDPDNIVKRWQHNHSRHPRDTHLALGLKNEFIPFNQPFEGLSAPMMYCHDPVGGAENSVFCRCVTIYRIRGKVV